MFLLVPVIIFFLHEKPVQVDSRKLLDNARKQLVKIGKARTMWAAAGLMALFYIAPGLSTAIFYKQQNELHLDTQGQGFLYFISGVCGVSAAVGYGLVCRRFNLRTLLIWCMTAATVANIAYIFYSSVGRARVIEGINGFGYTLAELALMDLAIRATPAGSEGLGFSVMISVRNLALFSTDWFGSKSPGPVSFFVQLAGNRQLRDDPHHSSPGVPIADDHRRPQGRGDRRGTRAANRNAE